MSASLCASVNSPSSGAIACDKSMKKLLYLIKTEKEFSSSDYATATAFIAAIRAAGLLARNSSDKLHTFPLILDLQDNSSQNTTGNLGDGPIEVLQEGAPGYTGGFKAGSKQVQNLRTLANGSSQRYFGVDEDNVAWGYRKANGNFVGLKLDTFVNSDRFRAQGAVKGQVMTISASDPKEFAQSRYLSLPATFVATDYGSLVDIQLYRISNVTNVFKIDGLYQSAEVKESLSMYAKFTSLLASAPLWYAKNAVTGATIALTSVAVDGSLLCYTVTVDNTAYGALASGTIIEFGLVAPTALDAANVTDVDALSFTYTKP